ncbi:capping complex subunit for YIEGIA [Candidatus Pristimantibacillus sp. PTI5]|uniref:capping complex subunit for YIEGIA n=1 Tax=Candidatus Pristimantibacillus sp. PTI5 TaxID=3400422 RepID=UPI003B0296DE
MAKIVAVVSMKPDAVGGGAPIFLAENADKLEETAFLLEKILDASAHDLKNGTIILVNHR